MNYLNGQKVSGPSAGILKSSAYVASMKDAMDDAGLTEMSLSLGFGIAAARNKAIISKKTREPETNRVDTNQRERILKNIEESKKAREASNFKDYLKREKETLEAIKKASRPKVRENLEGPVLDGEKSGSGKKVDSPNSTKGSKEFPNVSKEHGFPDVIDNYSRFSDEFSLVGGDGVKRKLFQIEGIYNGDKGVFEWIVDADGRITHRRFIKNGVVTGKPNQIPKK